MEWSIQEVARAAGTTSRTLRHYDAVGLLAPTRIGDNGYRYYDERALTRLQRILLLRELGLGIPAIAQVLAGERDDTAALTAHLDWLAAERTRLDRQIASVELTIGKLKEGEQLMAHEMFDGFDHTAYEAEVTERWGADSYAKGDAWWRAMTDDERRDHQSQHRQIAADYAAARDAGTPPESAVVQSIVARHVAWLDRASETTGGATGGAITAERLRGYGEMYVADPRFAKNYGGQDGAEYVRDAFAHYVVDGPA